MAKFSPDEKETDSKQAVILNYLSHNTNVPTRKLAEVLNLSITQVKFYLKPLLQSEQIVANGTFKNRTYNLKK